MERRPPLSLYKMLPRAGALAERFLDMGKAIRDDLQLDPELREIAIVRVGVITGADYEVYHHSWLAQQAGVSDLVLDAIKQPEPKGLSEREALVIAYTDALVRHARADNTLFQNICAVIGENDVAELTLVIGFYIMTSRFLLNFDIEIETDFQHSTWS